MAGGGRSLTVLSFALAGRGPRVTLSLGDAGLGEVRALRPPSAWLRRLQQKWGLAGADGGFGLGGPGGQPWGLPVVFGQRPPPGLRRAVALLLVGLRCAREQGEGGLFGILSVFGLKRISLFSSPSLIFSSTPLFSQHIPVPRVSKLHLLKFQFTFTSM